VSLKYPALDQEYNCLRWEFGWQMTEQGPKWLPTPIPFPCQCCTPSCYGYGGIWYCLTCWIASRQWE
jgi:hypothetical protein